MDVTRVQFITSAVLAAVSRLRSVGEWGSLCAKQCNTQRGKRFTSAVHYPPGGSAIGICSSKEEGERQRGQVCRVVLNCVVNGIHN